MHRKLCRMDLLEGKVGRTSKWSPMALLRTCQFQRCETRQTRQTFEFVKCHRGSGWDKFPQGDCKETSPRCGSFTDPREDGEDGEDGECRAHEKPLPPEEVVSCGGSKWRLWFTHRREQELKGMSKFGDYFSSRWSRAESIAEAWRLCFAGTPSHGSGEFSEELAACERHLCLFQQW